MKRLGTVLAFGLLTFNAQVSLAQTELRITGPESAFPIAVPQLCNAGGGGSQAIQIADTVSKNLQISSIFNVLNPSSFVETPGKCVAPNQVAYSDWSVIGADGLVQGKVTSTGGSNVQIELYLHDVQRKSAVVGKRYEANIADVQRVAHRFSNEIIKYFTGEEGVFGTRIAYVSKVGRFKELFIVDLDGSNARQLTRDLGLAMSPSWSPAGDQIVYTSYRTRKPELYLVSPEGGQPVRITDRDGTELGPEFSPNGTSIAASTSEKGIFNISMFDLRGRLLRNITDSTAIDVSPSWSPDGGQIAFCSNRGGGPQIYIMNADGSNVRRISFADSNYCTSPAWSPKGDKIAYVCRSEGHNVFMTTPQGSDTVQLTFAGYNEDPSWSPDGKYLAYSTNQGGAGKRNIVIVHLQTLQTRLLRRTDSEDSQPAWSPRVR